MLARVHLVRAHYPARGSLPHFNDADILAAYGANQTAASTAWAAEFLGLYWLVARRRLEHERPDETFAGDGPDWGSVRRRYVESLHWFSTLAQGGMTLFTAMRLHFHLRQRGEADGLDELALVQVRAGMEPIFSGKKSRIRVERVGQYRVSGMPRPPARDYMIAGAILPQVGHAPRAQQQVIKEV